jgi:hypothetical protein
MSKIESFKRYNTIYKQLRKKDSTAKEIMHAIEQQGNYEGIDLVRDMRTFLRDKEDMMELFQIYIQYDKNRKVYTLNTESNYWNTQLLETFDWLQIFQTAQDMKQYIAFDTRNTKGVSHISTIMEAIKAKKVLEITHHINWESDGYLHQLAPLAVKQSQYRWYLVAEDVQSKVIKTFALDRVSEINISQKKYAYPQNFDVHKHFKDYFGVIFSENTCKETPEIVLSFEPSQKNYVSTLPLHASQVVLVDNDLEYRIQLSLHITFDLIREILSYGKYVKIISPRLLIERIEEEGIPITS